MAFGIRLSDLFELPSQLEDLAVPLNAIWDQVELVDYVSTFVLPELPDGEDDTSTPMTLDEALELLTDTVNPDEIPETPDVPPVEITSNPVDTGKREIKLQLEALSDIELSLFPGFTVILNPGGFEAKVTAAENHVAIETALGLAARIDANLLRPMVKTSAGTYEPDASRSSTQINLGTVTIKADTTGNIDFIQSVAFHVPYPVQLASTPLIVDSADIQLDFTGETKGLALRWKETQLKQWLKRIVPLLADQSAPEDSDMTARILLNDTGTQEVRVDWTMSSQRTLELPGINIITPSSLMFTLLLGGADRQLSDAALAVTLLTPQTTRLTSTFAWGRGGERELQTNRTAVTPDPFVTIELNNTESLSLALVDINLLSIDEMPTFFREFQTSLTQLDFNNPETLFEPTPTDFVGLQKHWTGILKVNKDAFRMPFLEQSEDNERANQFSQWLEIKPQVDTDGIKFDLQDSEIKIPCEITIKFGGIEFTGDVTFTFNWETMSLGVDHESGISMATNSPQYPADGTEQSHLGLYWRLRGAPLGNGRYEYFRVVTKNYNYQIQMAQGAAFELEYREISDEPILFIISDFVLSPNGIDLTAEVSDRPARLNGIDARFRFSGSRLEIKNNRIEDLTLAGSGPLPPDLVGESMVDIALQFKQVDGNLTLVAGKAELQGNKLLECKGTRFQFAIDAIGVKFVRENRFHLYFTLTGSAQFVLASGDDSEGALALLPKIKIDMVECPLCGDVSVLAKHIKFIVELPKPLKFSFLKCFEFELRGFGFIPEAPQFDGLAAMQLSGQIFFAQGGGDIIEAKIEFHNLLIGLPKKGSFFPQIDFKRIDVKLKVGEAFELNGAVEFYDTDTMKGFAGEGMVDLKGMPQLAAAFSFVRVRRDENSNWVRAWFIYLEVRKVSFMIPVVQVYLREIGLGFGYRYTIASIKAVDQENDIRALRTELVRLSRTQAELAKIESWAVDLEDPGEDPRWTIVFRAMIAQNSASPGALQYNEAAEELLPNLFLLDAMIAFRSDLTFYMTIRGWLNTNYHEFVSSPEVRTSPLYSGFVLLSPRRKMFFMAVASNPDGFIGDHPPLPDFVKEAIRGITFSATLLITPGLLHFELGWPNKLGWGIDLGILKVECRGGFIFRITPEEIVIGISYEARGRLDIKAELDLGVVGVWVRAVVQVGFGARVIAVLPFNDITGTIVYGAIGLELMIRLEFGFWIKIPLGLFDIKLEFSFSLEIGFTATAEIAIGVPPQLNIGMRGRGTLWIAVMGHRLQVSASLGFRDDFVEGALSRTKHVLDLGLEATDTTDLPGFTPPDGGGAGVQAVEPAGIRVMAVPGGARGARLSPRVEALAVTAMAEAVEVLEFHLPGYSAFVMRNPDPNRWSCLVIFPRGEYWDQDKVKIEEGFLPPPPLKLVFNLEADYLDQGIITDVLRREVKERDNSQLSSRARVTTLIPGRKWQLTDYAQSFDVEGHDRHLHFIKVIRDRVVQKPFEIDIDFLGIDTIGFHDFIDELNRGQLSQEVIQHIDLGGFNFSSTVQVLVPGQEWKLSLAGNANDTFRLRLIDLNAFIFRVVLLHDAFDVPIISENALNTEIPTVISDALTALNITLNNPTIEGSDNNWLLRGIDAQGKERQHRLHLVEDTNRRQHQIELVQQGNVDFSVQFPTANNLTFAQYDPTAQTWQTRDLTGAVSWSVRWHAPAFSGDLYPNGADGKPGSQSQAYAMNLADYLSQAYISQPITSFTPLTGQSVPAGDPNTDLFTTTKVVQEDGRVYNPSDSAFEAAVRGAAEQFAGSPFFRLDASNPYDKSLQDAFHSGTTIYHASGKLTADNQLPPAERAAEAKIAQEATNNQTAMQARGVIVHDIVADLRAYAEHLFKLTAEQQSGDLPPAPPTALDADTSIPFNLGLVFAYKGSTPTWLDSFDIPGESLPQIHQRLSIAAVEPDAEVASIETFNVKDTDFTANPPEFSRVQHYTSSNTVAITWDLRWRNTRQNVSTPRDDPNHHLAHYEVRRRALNGREREVVYTVKPAEVLHREDTDSDMRRLRARFNVVDNFNHETAEEQAAMPPDGLSYIYTITPVDFSNHSGRPLTLVATRYPSQPPFVPANAQLVMSYQGTNLPGDQFVEGADEIISVTQPGLRPRIISPHAVELLNWDQGFEVKRGPRVPAHKYYLLFRKEQTLPIGSYGLDAATAVSRIASRPVSNARPLPTDIRVDVSRIQNDSDEMIAALQAAGVLPADALWRPEAWTVYIQTESLNGVRSALVPVELRMKITAPAPAEDRPPISEERQLAMLEWLTQPLQFPYLPPEDQTSRTGLAHFPMTDGIYTFGGSLSSVKYKPHPLGIRAIRFRWNQAPSSARDYPLNLNAGYHLYQLDADAYTDETLENERIRVLRRLQEVQMIPAEDLPFFPADTLAVNQWEAWYPSAVLRHNQTHPVETSSGQQQTRSSWYSWRDSRIIWPECPSEFVRSGTASDGGVSYTRAAQMHPALARLVNDLRTTYHVDLQLYPPDMPSDLPAFMQTTSPKTDVYGWGVLQRFGLSVTFSLRSMAGGDPAQQAMQDESGVNLVPGKEALEALQLRLNNVDIIPEALKRHLYVEVLFQPSRATNLSETDLTEDAMLAIVQVSLRPVVEQYQRYRKLVISGLPGSIVAFGLRIKSGVAVSMDNVSQEGSGQVELQADDPNKDKLWQTQFTIPLRGELVLAVRAVQLPDPLIPLTQDEKALVIAGGIEALNQQLTAFGCSIAATDNNTALFLVLTRDIAAEEVANLVTALGGSDPMKALVERARAVHIQPFSPEALEAQGFSVSDAMIAAMVSQPNSHLDWETFRKYAESLSGPDEPRIHLPTNGDALKSLLPQYMDWSARFFDHTGEMKDDDADGLHKTGTGAWLATAYPRVTTPTYASPDEAGRLKYDHLIEDKWAHNYRHYILPYGRYDLLWQNIWQSPIFGARRSVPDDDLTPEQRRMPQTFPTGGLDVVLDRTRPVDRPLILRSGRLDRPALPGQPVPPGATWEVIVARHTEQAMIERNQTLARQVAFRQVSFTLLRRFAYPAWKDGLLHTINHAREDVPYAIDIRPVETYSTVDDSLPAYPALPDHIDTRATLTEAEGLSLDLPQRLAPFQQGALVLQWQSLPFYYQYKLLLIAQSSTTVSPFNEVVQRDFEYISPPPDSRVSLHSAQGIYLIVKIPLNSLWESLPPEAQALWESEQPDAEDNEAEIRRKYASLPDPEVVYQIVESFNGNVEVQVEYFYEEKVGDDGELVQHYTYRQLGKDFLNLDAVTVIPPALPQGRFFLTVILDNKLQGDFTLAEEVVWDRPQDLLDQPANGLIWPDAKRWLLVWEGELTDQQKVDILALPGDSSFKAALRNLVDLAAAPDRLPVIRVPVPLPPEPMPPLLAQRYTLHRDDVERKYVALSGIGGGLPADLEIAELRTWGARVPELAEAVENLLVEMAKPLDNIGVDVDFTEADIIAVNGLVLAPLIVTPTRLEWSGPAPTLFQLMALTLAMQNENLSDVVREAIRRLFVQITQTGRSVNVPLDIDLRPAQGDLPETLAEQLLLGRYPVVARRLISDDEVQRLIKLFEFTPEKRAIYRLATATLTNVLRGRKLELRTRRGSAAPSSRLSIPVSAEGV